MDACEPDLAKDCELGGSGGLEGELVLGTSAGRIGGLFAITGVALGFPTFPMDGIIFPESSSAEKSSCDGGRVVKVDLATLTSFIKLARD